MRLGFVSGRKHLLRGRQVYTDAGMGRLIDALAKKADRMTVALSPAAPNHPLMDHALSIDASSVFPLPEMVSFRTSVYKHAPCAEQIHRVETQSDVTVVQLPFPAPSALLRPAGSRVYHVCADVLALTRASPHYAGALRIPAVGAALAVDTLQRLLVLRRGDRVVTNGQALLRRFPPAKGRSVVSSSIHDEDILSVSRKRSDNAFRILFVGYLRPEKGLDTLIDAFEQVREQVPHAELHVVGPSQVSHEHIATRLAQRIERLVQRKAVSLLGPRGFGPELFQCFADADLLVVTSHSEGTPRVLVEARAFGCPVVATNVGGIPSSVEDGVDGLLVPPSDPARLTAAMVTVARNEALRSRLREEGISRARRTTVEAFAEAIMEEAREVASSRIAVR